MTCDSDKLVSFLVLLYCFWNLCQVSLTTSQWFSETPNNSLFKKKKKKSKQNKPTEKKASQFATLLFWFKSD